MEFILIFYKYINNIFRLGFVLKRAENGIVGGVWVFLVSGQAGKTFPDWVLRRFLDYGAIRDLDAFRLVWHILGPLCEAVSNLSPLRSSWYTLRLLF
ncbi:hypothetical protein [Alcaligenes faecalis]|uniref:hypothetical protein n=1 Tax=Alcaligenes faecalis TaxID=511 RepID=UPI000F0BA2BD|nr:hypothetical protein [Alcaligenes faecalis]AYR21655.1 hypothetical protein D6I95_15635 [Alcaligenes faecalis]